MLLEIRWPALAVWCVAWLLLWGCEGVFNLGNLALLLVLASALSSLWLSALVSMGFSALSVALFNWFFVPPRFTFSVDLHQDLLLLTTMLGVSTVVSYLMARLRAAVATEVLHARAADDLRLLGDRMRESNNLSTQIGLLRELLERQSLCSSTVMVGAMPMDESLGALDSIQRQGLHTCMQEGVALGAGTGRYENHWHVFLPLRGRSHIYGSVVVSDLGRKPCYSKALKDYLQQACDMLGLEIERAQTFGQAQKAREEVQHQSLRNTLLTSISHDYRTPLASLMGAASAIHDQAERLSVEKIQALSQTVLDEAQHLNRMTTNTLQLARLDSSPLRIRKDWESVHEFLGSVMTRIRQRFPRRILEVIVPENVPLVHCDALLLVQLYENLLENAIKYSPPDTPIRVQVTQDETHIRIHVMDQGCGIDDAWKERVFQVFERVQSGSSGGDASDPERVRRGVGVGLAVCQAIARVHDATITVQDNSPHGTIFCVSFPVMEQPPIDI